MTNVKNNFSTEDSITIHDLEIPCRVGCTKEERSYPQLIYLTLQLFLPLKNAGTTDNIDDTVDYAAIALKLQQTVCQNEFVLIETIAETSAKQILSHKLVQAVQVNVSKKILPGIDKTSVTIFRKK